VVGIASRPVERWVDEAFFTRSFGGFLAISSGRAKPTTLEDGHSRLSVAVWSGQARMPVLQVEYSPSRVAENPGIQFERGLKP